MDRIFTILLGRCAPLIFNLLRSTARTIFSLFMDFIDVNFTKFVLIIVAKISYYIRVNCDQLELATMLTLISAYLHAF